MSRSREIDEQINALAEEKKRFQSEAALAREYRSRQHGQRRVDDRELPMGYWLGWGVAEKTRGSARLDLVRPRFPAVEPNNLLRRASPAVAQGAASLGIGRSQGSRGYQDNHRSQNIFNIGQGARIKVMRHIDFGVPDRFRRQQQQLDKPRHESRYNDSDFGKAFGTVQDALQQNFKPPEKPWFDFGAGVNLELDDGQLTPTVRLKVKDFFSIKLLPQPMFKIQKRLRLGPSTMGVRVNYELPLANAENLWAPPARLMLRLDNHMGGLRVGPGGADFDESVLQLGDSTAVRAAMSVDFPKTLPLEEGEKLFGWRARRLGVKTRW